MENSNIALLNSLIEFRIKNGLEDVCILEVIMEYAQKHNLDDVQLAAELADYKPFQDIVHNDLIKHKYVRNIEKGGLEDW